MLSKSGLAGSAAIIAMVAMTYAGEAAAQQAKTEDTTEQAQEVLTGGKSAPRKRPRTKQEAKLEAEAAKSGESQPQLSNESGRLEGDILVLGLRENVKSARNAKRRASQIVDVVIAQDINKLPDKNIPEALARVPGVQIDRDRGEGGQVRIRGLTGALTTINGSPTFSAGDRTTYLNDISSDLAAAIEVFKTRTPDQVEGSQTGVINITLRRPTDFKEGATYALMIKGDYADQIRQVNPYASALIAYNADTPLGKFGFTVNGTYNNVRYNESIRYNGFPGRPNDPRQVIIPAGGGSLPSDIFIPNQVGFSGPNGWSKRVEFQISTQWRPDDHWSVTIEGGYRNQKMRWNDNQFDLPITYSASNSPPPILSNVVLGEDGRLVKSLTVTSLDPFGPGRQSWRHENIDYNFRGQIDYISERIEFNAWANARKSNNYSANIFHWVRFNQNPQFDVVFNDTSDPKGGSNVTFRNIDLLDPANYLYVDGFNQSRQFTNSPFLEMVGNLRINTYWNFIDWFKVGYRYENRKYNRQYGDRGANNLRIPISSLPDYELESSGKGFQGTKTASNAEWLIGGPDNIWNSFNAIRARAAAIYPNANLQNFYPTYNPFAYFEGSDGSHSYYGMFHYNMKLLFPIDGVIGARIVNSLVDLNAFSRQEVRRSVTLPNGQTQTQIVVEDGISRGEANYLNILPSINAIVHFTPKLQLRLAYTGDIGRPSAYQLNPQVFLNVQNQGAPTGNGGNASLGPIKSTKYDASLEWYFGATGSASIAVWQWDQEGQVANQSRLETLPASPNVPILVTRPYNLGRGRHRGIEGSVTSFFTFLPGILKSFGGSVNGTLNITRGAFPTLNNEQETVFIYTPYTFVSKFVGNVVGFFERDGLNIRVAYNWRSRQQVSRSITNPYDNQFIDPIERLDASINYDITKNLTVAIEGSNLTANGGQWYWGSYAVPRDIRYFSRNFSLSLRARF